MDQTTSNNYALDNLLHELELISDLSIRNFTTQAILHAPGVFWYRQSAFVKGHHPSDEYNEWGNLIHVKRVLVIAKALSQVEEFSSEERDCLYSGMLIHDIGKYGIKGDEERILTKTHADLVELILSAYDLKYPNSIISRIVVTHMGRWGKVKPSSLLEHVGHYSDCIASRVDVSIPITLK